MENSPKCTSKVANYLEHINDDASLSLAVCRWKKCK